jgi:Cu2+-exporting ATPase
MKEHNHSSHNKSDTKNHQQDGHSKEHAHDHHDHKEHHHEMAKDFSRRFWISLVITLPLLFLSTTIQGWFGYDFDFEGRDWVIFGMASFLFFYGGWPFLKGLFDELKDKAPGMMTLIALAITVAYVYSSAIVFGLSGTPFFWELSTLIVVMLAGHWIEMRSVMQAGSALEKLKELMPDMAHRIGNGGTEDVKSDELKAGDKVLVKPGEKIPADAAIYEGKSSIDESVITGESKPVKKEPGDEVIGGSINGNGSLKVEISKNPEESYLSNVIGMVEEAKKKKSKTQHLADRAAFWLTIIAISAGAVTLAGWLLGGREFNFALNRMVTVMVIACPHALGLAVPLVVAISTSLSARNGLLVRNRTAFENARKIDTVVFDKTGTLTVGEFGVTDYGSLNDNYSKKQVLSVAASIEQESEHPIARGILEKARELELDLPGSKNIENLTGEGIQGEVDGKKFFIVGPGYLDKMDIEVNGENGPEGNDTVVYLIEKKEVVGFIALSDRLRETSAEAVDRLKGMGIESWIITGDSEKVTREIAGELNLAGYFAEVLPDQKRDKIRELREKGRFVAMTGDGVNDALALTEADVGIAIGSGTDVAAESADIILVDSNPMDVTKLIGFGKATHKKMIQNLIYATAYNAVALPLGAGALFWAGIMISPAVGAILMSLSTVAVAVNAQFLKKKLN